MMAGEDNEPTQRPSFDETNLLSSSEDFRTDITISKLMTLLTAQFERTSR